MNARNIRFAHEDWSMIGKVIERLRPHASLTLIRNLDPRIARPVVLDQTYCAAACDGCNRTQPCEAGPPSREMSLVP
jgi:hypothetical protein